MNKYLYNAKKGKIMESKQKKLGFFNLMTMAIGYTIGSGIFAMLPAVIGMSGRSTCLAMAFGAVVMTFASVVPAIFLSSTLDLPGGQYSQGVALLPKGLAGIYGIMCIVPMLTFAGSVVSLTAYIIQMIPGLATMDKVVSFILAILFFLIGVKGISLSAKLQDIAVIVLLIALGTYVFLGLPNVDPNYFAKENFFSGGTAGFLTCAAFLSLSASGGFAILSFTSVAKNPKRNIPLAMLASALLVTILYFFIAIVTAGILPIEEVSGQTLGIIAITFMSKPVYIFFMIGGAMLALGTTINSQLASFQYPVLQMAKDGWLPKSFLKHDSKFNYPYVIMIIAFVIGAIIPIVSEWDITTITSLFGVPGFVMYVIIAIASLKIPRKFPNRWKASTFHVPTPVFYVLMILSALSSAFLAIEMALFLDGTTFVIVGVIVLAVCVYIWLRWKRGHVDVGYIESIVNDNV